MNFDTAKRSFIITGGYVNGVRPQYGQDTVWPHVFMADR